MFVTGSGKMLRRQSDRVGSRVHLRRGRLQPTIAQPSRYRLQAICMTAGAQFLAVWICYVPFNSAHISSAWCVRSEINIFYRNIHVLTIYKYVEIIYPKTITGWSSSQTAINYIKIYFIYCLKETKNVKISARKILLMKALVYIQ